MNGPPGNRWSDASSGRTPMTVVARSGAVALAAAVVTAGVVAVTAASAEKDAPPPSTTTTTEAPPEPIDLNEKEFVPFSCTEVVFGVLTPVDVETAYDIADAVSGQIGHPVHVIDRSACSNRGSESSLGSSTGHTIPDDSDAGDSEAGDSASGNSGNGSDDSKEANQNDQILDRESESQNGYSESENREQWIDPIVNLLVGPFDTKEAACEVKQSIKKRINESKVANEEMNLAIERLNAWWHVSRPGSGDPASDPSLVIDCADPVVGSDSTTEGSTQPATPLGPATTAPTGGVSDSDGGSGPEPPGGGYSTQDEAPESNQYGDDSEGAGGSETTDPSSVPSSIAGSANGD